MREGKGERIELHLLVPAGIAVVYTLIILVVSRFNHQSGTVVGISSQAAETDFALKEGQTIVGVMDTKKGIRFYIGKDVMDGKNYE